MEGGMEALSRGCVGARTGAAQWALRGSTAATYMIVVKHALLTPVIQPYQWVTAPIGTEPVRRSTLHDTHSVEHRRTTWAIAQFQAPAFGPQIFVIGKPDVARRIVSAIADQKGERLICVVAGMRQPYRALEKRFPVLVWFLKLERFFGDLYA